MTETSNNEQPIKHTQAIFLIGKIRGQANKFILSELAKCGMTQLAPSHGDILLCLYRHDVLSMKQIAAAIHRTKPTVTVLVNKLAELQLAEKAADPDDARSTLVRLTPKGLAFRKSFEAISQNLAARLTHNIPAAEMALLETTLAKILRNLEQNS